MAPTGTESSKVACLRRLWEPFLLAITANDSDTCQNACPREILQVVFCDEECLAGLPAHQTDPVVMQQSKRTIIAPAPCVHVCSRGPGAELSVMTVPQHDHLRSGCFQRVLSNATHVLRHVWVMAPPAKARAHTVCQAQPDIRRQQAAIERDYRAVSEKRPDCPESAAWVPRPSPCCT